MSEAILIREAAAADLEVILHHRRAMFHEMGHTDTAGLEAMLAAARAYYAQGLRDGSYRGWLALDGGGRVIGGGGIGLIPWPPHPQYPHPQRATIFNVYTEPEARRRGVARCLMQVMIEWCREQQFPWVHLHASEYGRPLYEAMGFAPTNEMRLLLE
ncbi:MAG: GNAT family N-acetyltransferase [Terriglobia bacterium]